MNKRIFFSLFLALTLLAKCGFISIDKDVPRLSNSLVTNTLVLSGADNFDVGTCQPVSIRLVDPNGANIATSTELTAVLAQSGTAKFYSDASCLSQVTQVALQAGVFAQLYISDTKKESLVLEARTTPSQFYGVKATQSLATSATQLAFSFPLNSATYQCVPGRILALDGFQNTTSRHGLLSVNLNSSGLNGFHFYSDVFCLNPITQSSINSGSEETALYVQAPTIGSTLVTGTSAGLTSAQSQLQFSQGQSPYLSLVSATGNLEVNSCTAITVEARRADGNYYLVLDNALSIQTTILSGSQVTLHSDSGCTTSLASLSINPNQFQTTFYLKTTQAPQTVSITNATSGFLSGSASLNFVPKVATLVQLSGVPSSINPGTCSQAIVTLKDAQGNDAYIAANTTVNFSLTTPDVTQTDIFASTNCSGGTVTNITIPKCSGLGSCASGLAFSFRPKKIGLATLSALSTGLSNSSQSYSVQAPVGVPTQVNLVRLTDPATAGSCLTYSLQAFDAYGNDLYLSASRTMALTSSSSFGTFYNSNCQSQISSIVFPANSHEVTFSFRDTKAETVLLTAATTDFQAQNTTTLLVGAVQKLVFQNLPSQLSATTCSSAFQVVQKDSFDNLTTSAVTFTVSSTNNGKFYSDSDCSTLVTQGSIAAGSSTSSNFYVSVPQSGSTTLTALGSSPVSLTGPASATLNVNVAPALHLALNCEGSNCTSMVAGDCRKLVLSSLDGNNSLFVPVGQSILATLSSSTASASFYSDAACNSFLANNKISLVSSANPKNIYVKDSTVETVTITASATSVQPSSLSLTVGAGSAEKLWVSQTVGASSVLAQTCSGPYQLTVQDHFGNTTTLSSASSVVFGSSLWNGAGVSNQAGFYSDAACTNTSVSIGSGSSTGNFYLKGAFAGTLVIRPQGINLGYANERSIAVNESAVLAFYNGSSSISGINFNTVPQGTTSSTQAITLVNTSSTAVAVVASLAGATSPYAIRSNTCTSNTTLSAGASCSFIVDFTPTSQTTFNGSLVATYSTSGGGANSTVSLSLTGVGGAPGAASLVVAPNTYDFGSKLINSSTTQSFTLTNQGGQAADTISFDQYGSSFTISMGTCVGTLAANSNCTFSVTFAPTAGGSYSAGVRLNYRNAITLSTVNYSNAFVLTGSAQRPANLIFEYLEYGFGGIPRYSQSSQYLLVQNFGDRPATNVAISTPTSGTNAGFGANYGTCGTTIAAGQSCFILSSFWAYNYGYASTTLKLNYNSDSSALSSGNVTLTGYGY